MRDARAIVITGGSSGIGAALAQHYAAPGVFIAISGLESPLLDAVAAACRSRGAACEATVIDVTDEDQVTRWVEAVGAARPIDLLIANAGISEGTSAVSDPGVRTRRILAVNIDGVVNTVLAALPAMRARGRGQIAIMSSVMGFLTSADGGAYCASKAAVRVWGEGLRAQLAPHGIGVSVVCPGFVDSRMSQTYLHKRPGQISAERAAAIIARGLAGNRARIVFPWWFYAVVRLVGALPPDGLAYLLRGQRTRH